MNKILKQRTLIRVGIYARFDPGYSDKYLDKKN